MDADVKYQIFDAPNIADGFEGRMNFIKQLIQNRCKCNKKTLGIYNKSNCPMVYTKQTQIKDENELNKFFSSLIKKGAEGVMLRAPNSPYVGKRTAYLLKVKPKFDDECRVIGYKPGTGKYEGMLGSFKCELVKDNNITFHLSGMNDDIRRNYKRTHKIGTIITFSYLGLTQKGVPRNPVYVRKRN